MSLQKVFVTMVTSSILDDQKNPELGFSDIGGLYKSKEEAEKDLVRINYKKVDGEKDIYEKLNGCVRHRYKIIERYIS